MYGPPRTCSLNQKLEGTWGSQRPKNAAMYAPGKYRHTVRLLGDTCPLGNLVPYLLVVLFLLAWSLLLLPAAKAPMVTFGAACASLELWGQSDWGRAYHRGLNGSLSHFYFVFAVCVPLNHPTYILTE